MMRVLLFLVCFIRSSYGQIPDKLNWSDFQKYQICNPVVAEQCFKDMDKNGDGIVTSAELDKYYAESNKRIEKMDEARYNFEFAKADINHDGKVSLDEALAFANEYYVLTPALQNFIEKTVDSNADGQLSKDEFVYFRKHAFEI